MDDSIGELQHTTIGKVLSVSKAFIIAKLCVSVLCTRQRELITNFSSRRYDAAATS